MDLGFVNIVKIYNYICPYRYILQFGKYRLCQVEIIADYNSKC